MNETGEKVEEGGYISLGISPLGEVKQEIDCNFMKFTKEKIELCKDDLGSVTVFLIVVSLSAPRYRPEDTTA